MAYTKKTWVSGETPLSAENMNNIENGIANAHEDISKLNTNSFQGMKRAGYKDQTISLKGNGTAYLFIMVHNGAVGNNGLYIYYPATSMIFTFAEASHIAWTCNGYDVSFTSSSGTPYMSYIIVA